MALPFITFVHPDDVEETLERTQELASRSGTELLSFENRYRTSSGEFRSIKWDVVSDAQALYCVARDVTDGKAGHSPARTGRERHASRVGERRRRTVCR